MTVNLIVLLATLLMAGFILVWALYPACRPWLEAPKLPPARWDTMPPDESRPQSNLE